MSKKLTTLGSIKDKTQKTAWVQFMNIVEKLSVSKNRVEQESMFLPQNIDINSMFSRSRRIQDKK